jgi:hypothetical protein
VKRLLFSFFIIALIVLAPWKYMQGQQQNFGPTNITYCGATSGAIQLCAKTPQSPTYIIFGDVTLNTAATQSITTLPFTSSSSYACMGSDLTTAAGTVSFPTYASGAAATIQETSGVNTDHLRYMCVGY